MSTRSSKAAALGLKGALDPISFEVLRNRFEYCCVRMSKVLQKTAFSPAMYDIVDFSNAIYDPELRLLSQAANCPVHLAAMHFSAKASVDHFGRDTLREGDVVFMNDPYLGGTHIPDVTFTMPIFHGGRLIGYGVSRGHWTDLGGGAPGGYSFGTHIAAEGLRVPPIKIFNNYRINDDLRRILLSNTRMPQYIDGDIHAHMGALRVAEQELQRIAERYGDNVVFSGMNELIAYTERMTRAAIRKIPNGVYEGEDFADSDGISDDPIRFKVTLTVEDEDIVVDFTGSDPIAAGAINSPMANTISAVYYTLKFFLDPNAPANAGMWAPIKVILPENCFLNPKWPAPTIGCTVMASSKVSSSIWLALAKAIPDRITAPTFADTNALLAGVRDPDSGAFSVFIDLPPGGWGGTPTADGLSATFDPLGNCANLPAETAELNFPVIYEAFDLIRDSAGPGLNRGGLGTRLKVRFLGPAEISVETSRTRAGTPGVNGGGGGPPQRVSKIHLDGQREVIGGLREDGSWRRCVFSLEKFQANETYMFEATGGGGWGDPLKRAPDKVLEDVLDDYVSIEGARRDYGVVIDPTTLSVDGSATAALRRERQRQAVAAR